MYGKVHVLRGQTVLACCDRELVGRRIMGGRYDVRINSDFYGEEAIGREGLAKLLGEADSINLMGKRAVGVALEEGFIKESDIIRIKGIPHILIFRV